VKENERCIKVIENLENKVSQLKQDVTELREQYHKEKLSKDVLTQEKHVLCKFTLNSKQQKCVLFFS
jgi:hypothetical protein